MNNIFKNVTSNSIVAIDVEGDARNSNDNRRRFPNGIHYDPDTIVWCITFAFKDLNRRNEYTHLCL